MRRLGVYTVMFLAVLALFAVIPNLAGAATAPGPDAYGYTATDVPGMPGSWQNISGTGTAVLSNDQNTFTSAPIGFDFNFYGKPATARRLSATTV